MSNTHDGDDPPKRRLRLAKPASYDVGYGKPPVTTRFKPGATGNPKGRPRGSKNRLPALSEERLNSIILDEAYRTIKVRDGEKNVSVPMATAVVRAIAVNAAKGNNRAALLFTQMVKVVEDQNKASYDDYVKTMISYKVDWDEEIERCRRLGIPLPHPVPHPDDIRINFNTGEVRITGPYCKEDIPKWERARARKKQCDEDIAAYRKELETETDPGMRQIILCEIDHTLRIRAIICTAIPD